MMIDLLSFITPPDMSQPAALLLIFFSFIGSLITVAFGIGGGALLLAVMAVTVPSAALVPVHGVVQVGSNLGRAILLVRHTFWHALPWFIVGSVIGVVLGGRIVVQIEPWVVQTGVGLFILWSISFTPPKWLSRWPLMTGLISSFLTMFFGATGMFVATFSKSLSLGRHSHVATHATLMLVQHLFKSVTFAFLGFAFLPWLVFIMLMILAGVLGTLVGNMALKHMTDARFHRALDIVLGLIALRLVWSGLRSAFGE